MVELKSGETYNGIIKAVDKFTNIKMEAANLNDKVLNYMNVERASVSQCEGSVYQGEQH